MEEREREKREQRKKAEDLMSGRRSPLGHPMHRSPMPEKSPRSVTGNSPVSPMINSKRDDRPSSVNTNARYPSIFDFLWGGRKPTHLTSVSTSATSVSMLSA
jgi:hypothetical protein